MNEQEGRGTTEKLSGVEAVTVRALTAALNFPDLGKGLKRLGEMVTCLVEGSPQPPPVEPPPKGFRLRAWQVIDKDAKTFKLYLNFENQPTGTWKVQVDFEGSDKPYDPKDLKAEVEFDLPKEWVDDAGPTGARFVTVYLRKEPPPAPPPGEETHKATEEPSTIIRMIPAATSKVAARYFDDIEAEDADD
jgi:hypothetical protein